MPQGGKNRATPEECRMSILTVQKNVNDVLSGKNIFPLWMHQVTLINLDFLRPQNIIQHFLQTQTIFNLNDY